MLSEMCVGDLIGEPGGDIQTGPFGTKLKAAEYTTQGVPIISVGEVGYGRLRVHRKTPRVDETVTRRMPEYLLEPGDIVFGRKGAVDRSALVLEDQRGWFLGSDGIRLRLPSSCDARFMSYQFQAPRHREWMMRHAAGTTMASLNEPIIRSIPIVLPPLGVQRAIAAVLGALDDKIEQNRRTAQALERLARAIFRAWFVDFEPVKAKAAGATAFPSMPQPVFDALPTRFVDSEVGPVPEGWKVKLATDVATVAIGKTPPRKEPHWFTNDPSHMPWVSIRDMGICGAFIGATSEYLTNAAVERFRVRRIPDRSVLFSFKLTVGRVAIADGEITSNEAIAHFVPNSPESMGTEYLYCYLIGFDHNLLGSTSSIATATNSRIVKEMPILVPLLSSAEEFTALTRPIFNALRSLTQESSKLAQLRDYLLPKLLSGTVRVKEAERLLEVAQ
jgi:type I restriction enzyme S subunit